MLDTWVSPLPTLGLFLSLYTHTHTHIYIQQGITYSLDVFSKYYLIENEIYVNLYHTHDTDMRNVHRVFITYIHRT